MENVITGPRIVSGARTTAQVARTISPQGNLVIRMYDELETLFRDPEFADLYPAVRQPAVAPFRLMTTHRESDERDETLWLPDTHVPPPVPRIRRKGHR